MSSETRAATANSVLLELEAQKESNRSAVARFDSFASFATHRERLTALVAKAASPDGSSRLAVLGAGNCYDLDLGRMATLYREVHLVDIDHNALVQARERPHESTRSRIFIHAPCDLSGLVDKLERWKGMQLTPGEALAQPDTGSKAIANALPGPFDVVVSACLLTQMQLVCLNVLGSSHPLLEGVRQIVNLTHLRTLARLTQVGGRALLVTDLVSNRMYPLDELDPAADLNSLTHQLVSSGNVIFVAHPGLITWMGSEDVMLKRTLAMTAPRDPWLWYNGPESVFLVYALEMTRIG